MSKAKFRSRKIDFKRPLPVYRATELPGLEDASALQRTAPIVETGVEKEEEEEHHLQAVISAAQAAVSGHGEKVAPLYIPTPDASRSVADYDKFYRPQFTQPTSYIRFTGPVEEAMGCAYCMDEEDEEWLNNFNKDCKSGQQVSEDVFESTMAQYERLTRDMIFTMPEDIPTFADLDRRAQDLLMPLDPHANLFYEHWKDRRVDHEYKPLMPGLKFEDGTRTSESDPYICFRRREVKQLRKTRRTDAHSMERLRKLHLELENARSLLEMVAKREKMRKESLVLEQIIFKQKCTVLDHRREVGHARDENDDLFGTKRKARKFTVNPAGPGYEMGKHTITIPLRKLKDYRDSASPTAAAHPTAGPRVSFVIPPKVAPTMTERAHREMQRRKALNDGWVDTTANPYAPFPSTYPHTFYQPLPTKSCLANPSTQLYHPYRVLPVTAYPDALGLYACPRRPTFRCRMGRGGRLYLDRRSMPRATDAAELHAQHRQQYGYDYDPFRYDDDGAADYDTVVLREPARRPLVRHRAAMLSDIDQRCLLTQPAFIPFSPATAAAAQSTPVTPTTSSQASGKPGTAGPTTNGGPSTTATTDAPQATNGPNHSIATTTATLAGIANGIGTPKSLNVTASPTVNGHTASDRLTMVTNSPGAKSAKTMRGTDAFRAMFGSPGAVTSPVASFMTSPATLALNGTHSPFASPLVKPAQTQDLR